MLHICSFKTNCNDRHIIYFAVSSLYRVPSVSHRKHLTKCILMNSFQHGDMWFFTCINCNKDHLTCSVYHVVQKATYIIENFATLIM